MNKLTRPNAQTPHERRPCRVPTGSPEYFTSSLTFPTVVGDRHHRVFLARLQARYSQSLAIDLPGVHPPGAKFGRDSHNEPPINRRKKARPADQRTSVRICGRIQSLQTSTMHSNPSSIAALNRLLQYLRWRSSPPARRSRYPANAGHWQRTVFAITL